MTYRRRHKLRRGIPIPASDAGLDERSLVTHRIAHRPESSLGACFALNPGYGYIHSPPNRSLSLISIANNGRAAKFSDGCGAQAGKFDHSLSADARVRDTERVMRGRKGIRRT